MQTGLKLYGVALARILGSTPAALYERQRALVRAGLLDAVAGHGPGSGTTTTAGSVALLVLATMASGTLLETESRARSVAAAAPLNAERCPLTSMKSFQDALAQVFTRKGLSRRVSEVGVSRTADRAWIACRDGNVSEFVGLRLDEPGMRVTAVLSGESVAQIAADVRAVLNAKFEQQERALAAAAKPPKMRKAS